MKVLTEFHQESLWWSMKLLFEDRLKWELYRPIGMDWYNKGYYRLYGHLCMKDPYGWLAHRYLEDTVYGYDKSTRMAYGVETRKGCDLFPWFKCLTLEQAKDTQFDYIICGIKDNERYLKRFRDEFCPNAKLIRHVGNAGDIVDFDIYHNVMSSDKQLFPYYQCKNKILYHQEFPLSLYAYTKPSYNHHIYSFINAIYENALANNQIGIWREYEHELLEYALRAYGAFSEDGKIYKRRDLVRTMQESSFFWQYKWGDGFGHVIYNAGALGRPILTAPDCYAGKLGEELLVDGETCLIDNGDRNDMFRRIRHYSREDRLETMCINMRERFENTVNFDVEFRDVIYPFLERCVL
jgi:hypothetical protein